MFHRNRFRRIVGVGLQRFSRTSILEGLVVQSSPVCYICLHPEVIYTFSNALLESFLACVSSLFFVPFDHLRYTQLCTQTLCPENSSLRYRYDVCRKPVESDCTGKVHCDGNQQERKNGHKCPAHRSHAIQPISVCSKPKLDKIHHFLTGTKERRNIPFPKLS